LAARKRKRSCAVTYGLLGAVVLACTGGVVYDRVTERRECVDKHTSEVVSDSYCQDNSAYHAWYYFRGHSQGIGSKATGGSYERGGFGRLVSGGGGG
jgi:hypothetical protein